jgi:hypothetical protein
MLERSRLSEIAYSNKCSKFTDRQQELFEYRSKTNRIGAVDNYPFSTSKRLERHTEPFHNDW